MNELFNLLPPQTCYLIFGLKLPFWLNFFVLGVILYKPFKFLLKSKYFRWLVIFLPPAIILLNLLRNDFFFQSDDFAHLYIADNFSFSKIFTWGMSPEGIWGFHHLFMGFWLFKAIFLFFGTRFEAYLLFNFFLHLINLSLFYLILKKIRGSSYFSVLTTFLFSIFYLSWISDIHELITATFFLLGVYLWLKWLLKPRRKDLWLFTLFYLLAIVSKEFTFILPVIVFLISVFWHYYVSKVNLKKIFLTLRPFFFFMVIYFLVYGKAYLGFFGSKAGGDYVSTLSPSIYLKNLLVYLTARIPIINQSFMGLIILGLIIIAFDFWKKKLILIPLSICYLLLLSPFLLLEHKIAPYYGYIPSIFLYLGLFVLLQEMYLWLLPFFKKRNFFQMVFNIYFVLIIIFGVFRLDQFLMDNCFLIHFPWPNPHRQALNSIVTKVDKILAQEAISENQVVKLEEDEITHEMKYLLNGDGLYLFLENERAKDYNYHYNQEQNSLTINKR